MTTHGTLTAYKNRGCRCDTCRRAAVRNVKRWRLRTGADLKTGIPAIPDLIDITPARDHYWQLRATGWTVADIAGEVGISTAHLSWLMGPANTRPRINRNRAAAILAIDPLEPVTFDTVLVDRFVNGEADWRQLTRDERCEAARRMDRAGVSRNAIAALTHLNSRTLWAAFDAEEIAS